MAAEPVCVFEALLLLGETPGGLWVKCTISCCCSCGTTTRFAALGGVYSGSGGQCTDAGLMRVRMRSYYVIVAWIWALIWYLGLDPIKWMMMYFLNEDGIRDKRAHKEAKRVRAEQHACWKMPCTLEGLLLCRMDVFDVLIPCLL